MEIRLEQPWLRVDLGGAHDIVAWTLNGGGCHRSDRVLWRELQDSDLEPDIDPAAWIQPSEAQERATARRIPLGRTGVDTECANVALFLACAMSDYVTGAVIPVDGGSR